MIKAPELDWKENKTPVSQRFDDVYFSVDDGLAESDYVFVKGCGVDDLLKNKTQVFVGETGFGTGLNFLQTWRCWKEQGSGSDLHFISVEAFPLSVEDLKSAHTAFPDLQPYSDQLVTQYPSLFPGFHRLVFEGGKVTLTLLLGEASEMYSQLEAKVDAWYLDGFAPAKNPEMWQQDLFNEMGRLSNIGATVSTFTAAGFVKRGLIEAGFEMSKRKGFGRKRDSLIGHFAGKEFRPVNQWFDMPQSDAIPKKIAVIGGGIAGCVLTYKLRQAGVEPVLFEREQDVGRGGSGNEIGLIKPRLSKEISFNSYAYLSSLAFYDTLPFDPWKENRGLFQMCKTDEEEELFQSYINSGVLPEEDFEYIDPNEASNRLGLGVERGGFWYARGGCVKPHDLCKQLVVGADVRTGVEIDDMSRVGDKWKISGENFDAVILANAGEISGLYHDATLPLSGKRGQVSYLESSTPYQNITRAITAHGYLSPIIDGIQLFGATFDAWPDMSDRTYADVTPESHQENLNKLRKTFPDYAGEVVGGRAGVRANTRDRLPIVGPLFKDEWYRHEYELIRHGKKAKSFPAAQYLPGLYAMTGLGARGLQNAPIMADILLSYLLGQPMPVPRDLREKLHPARFVIRELKKAKT